MFQSPNSSFDVRVAQGVAFLNGVRPGWHRDIDLSKLDVSSTQFCACALALDCEYGVAVKRHGLSFSQEIALGFLHPLSKHVNPPTEIMNHFAQLTTAWRKAITALEAGTYVGAIPATEALAA